MLLLTLTDPPAIAPETGQPERQFFDLALITLGLISLTSGTFVRFRARRVS